ncbi:MAG: hypothetical protein KatS3mg095_0064 [Candidatus Parcubacteria bacterium]|nr:MAG: hypothetical protein KatS3mg095_0064 [Candidatus Parcubacteria bacterium]
MSKKIFLFLLFIISFYYNNQVISPTIAIIEPIKLDENIFLNSNNLNNKYKSIKVIITGYSSNYDETDDTPWITASGEWVSFGTVASNFLSLGTKIKVPELFGNQIFIVKDRMNQRYNNKNIIDIWFPTKEEAKNFGIKETEIIILD